MQKKVLLLGGTGAMGVYLAPELRKRGYQVYITSRSAHTSDDPDIIFLTGNAKNIEFLRQVLDKKFDVIVDFMIYKTEEFRGRYQELLDTGAHYIFVSSYRVYGDSRDGPITEDSPRLLDSVADPEYLKTDEYALTKARQEDILRTAERKNWTIVRPAITYSKDRFQLGTLEAQDFVRRALMGKPVVFPRQMLGKQATMSWAGDVAKLIACLIENEKAMGQTYTVSTSEHHSWKEIMGYYQEILNLQVKIVDLAVYEKVVGGPYQIKYDRMLNRVVDNRKVLEATGMRQEDFMPLKDGLRMELENFRKDPAFRRVDPARDRKMDEAAASPLRAFVSQGRHKITTLRRLCAEKKLLSTLRSKLNKSK